MLWLYNRWLAGTLVLCVGSGIIYIKPLNADDGVKWCYAGLVFYMFYDHAIKYHHQHFGLLILICRSIAFKIQIADYTPYNRWFIARLRQVLQTQTHCSYSSHLFVVVGGVTAANWIKTFKCTSVWRLTNWMDRLTIALHGKYWFNSFNSSSTIQHGQV